MDTRFERMKEGSSSLNCDQNSLEEEGIHLEEPEKNNDFDFVSKERHPKKSDTITLNIPRKRLAKETAITA